MTLVQEVANRLEIPRSFVQALAQARPALLLGSILPDLPYHAHFGHQLALHFRGRSYLPSEWSDLLHTRGTGRLALGLLEHLRRSTLRTEDQGQVLAFTAGYLCHYAVDRAGHSAIRRVLPRFQQRSPSEPPDRLHARIERHQSLFYHLDRLGHDLSGSAVPRSLVRQAAGAGLLWPALPPAIAQAFRAACLQTHGRAPASSDLRDWLRGTTTYGELMSLPFARVEGLQGDLSAQRTAFYCGPDLDLATPLERGKEATLEVWRAAQGVLEAERVTSEVRSVFLHLVPDVDLGTGV